MADRGGASQPSSMRAVFEKYRLLRYRMAGGEPVFHEDRPIVAQSAD